MSTFVNGLGLFAIVFIIWWFWIAKPYALRTNKKSLTVHVKDGIYNPSRIEISANQSMTLNFLREDASPCAEYVTFDKLDIHEQLPLNKKHPIALENLEPGTYHFSCQMNMYQGELVVK